MEAPATPKIVSKLSRSKRRRMKKLAKTASVVPHTTMQRISAEKEKREKEPERSSSQATSDEKENIHPDPSPTPSPTPPPPQSEEFGTKDIESSSSSSTPKTAVVSSTLDTLPPSSNSDADVDSDSDEEPIVTKPKRINDRYADPSLAGKKSHAILKTRPASDSTYIHAEQQRQSQNGRIRMASEGKNSKGSVTAARMQKMGMKSIADNKENSIETEISVLESLYCKKCKIYVEGMRTVVELIVRCEKVIEKLDRGKSTRWNCYNGREKCVKAMAERALGLKELKSIVPSYTYLTNQKPRPTLLDDGNFKVTFPEGFARGSTGFKGILEDLKKLLAAEGDYEYDGGSGSWVHV
ncbi:hypothetical protein TrVE_jg3221 [Triparma verrucosa]|uniref:Uncharacterized protein n=1 Tax=Triparma verrucosa TaxID=1606542 RepID=A0A9W6ZAM7_9STRA|nr:hypothetical protein TrVE_jg3221 [Triparma verrucosa]